MHSNIKTKDRMRNVLGILAGAIIALVLFQNCQKSDFIIVTGVVTDSLTNLPVEGAFIVTPNGHTYTSASDGTFTIEGIKPGKTNFRVFSFRGYNQKFKSVIISNGRVTKVDFVISPFAIPEIETGRVTNITLHSASVTGILNLKSDVNAHQYGHCWSYSTSFPSLDESVGHTNNGGGSGNISFTSNLTGLQSDNIYYVRAYAITDAGVIYGNSVAFRTSDIIINSGLLAYYPFNGDVNDQSGNGSGVSGWNYSLTNDRYGNSNNALSCNSASFFYSYSKEGIFDMFNQFSISFWFYKSSWSGSNYQMICTGFSSNYTNDIRIGEEASPNKLYFDIKTGSGNTYKVSATSAPTLNMWHHVVAQRNNSEIQLYIDGGLQASLNCDNQPINNNINGWGGYLFVGSDLNSSPYFTGSMDDIRVYDRALTNSEIQYLKTH